MTETPIDTLKPGDLFIVFGPDTFFNLTSPRVGMRVEDEHGSGRSRARVPIVWMATGLLATLDATTIVKQEFAVSTHHGVES